MKKRTYKGIELVNVGLSWYIGPHDPLGHSGPRVHGRHIGNSFAAAKREIDRRALGERLEAAIKTALKEQES